MDIIILKSFIPETFLSLAILFQLIFNIRIVNNLNYNFPIIDKEAFYQTSLVLIFLLFLFFNLRIEGFLSNLLFVNDESTRIAKIATLLFCISVFHIISQSFFVQSINYFEFLTILLLSILAILLLLCSSDLMSFYLTIEMQSLCFYVLASFKRNSSFSTEAGLKYFISGAFISGFLLFGSTLLYGCLGTLNFNNLNILLSFPLDNNELKYLIQLGVVCVTSALLFKIACAPFHFWSPDVYEGSPLASTIIFSIIPKISLFYFFIKWISCLGLYSSTICNVLILFGVFSAFLGTFYALSQKRLKKLIIYSSIAQMGFLVSGLGLNTLGGFSSVLFFLFVYLITSVLVWGNFSAFYLFQNKISIFNKKGLGSLYLSSLTNMFRFNKLWSFSFIIIFFSIGGIPPLSGFLAKIFILLEMIKGENLLGSVLLILISSISSYYYIRVVKIMFFEPKISDGKYEKFQVIFEDCSLKQVYLIFSFFLFLLLIIFFYPTTILLFCEYLIFNITNF